MMAVALMAPATFWSASAADQTPKLVTEQFMIDTADPGINHQLAWRTHSITLHSGAARHSRRSRTPAGSSADCRNATSTGRLGYPRPSAVPRNAKPGLQLSVHLDRPGDVVFEHACKLGLEGIVSKRRGSRYECGRSSHWLMIKNPNHPAVLRLLEEDWNG